MDAELMAKLKENKDSRLTTLQALPLAFYPGTINPLLEHSNKVILPQRVLDLLFTKYGDELQYPILFEIQIPYNVHELDNKTIDLCLSTCIGVEEFSSNENYIYIPNHIVEAYSIQFNQNVHLYYISPPKGNFIKIQPRRTKFTEITNFKQKLEESINKYYPILKKKDSIRVYDPDTKESYYVCINECRPNDIITTTDTDLTVDFDEPLDYQTIQEEREKEKERQKKEMEKLWKIQKELEDKQRQKVLQKDKEAKEKKRQKRKWANNRKMAKKFGTFTAFSGKSNRLGN